MRRAGRAHGGPQWGASAQCPVEQHQQHRRLPIGEQAPVHTARGERFGGLALRPGLGYGALQPDPAGILDLPPGFAYRVISSLGDAMDDGFTVPDRADGMGCFDLGNGRIALVRNHALKASSRTHGWVCR